MPCLHVQAETTVTPEQFLAALTDFGPNRRNIWGNSQSTHFILHNIDANGADVTEGSKIFGGVWERIQYDWSNPHIIKLRATDSNIWAKGSGWQFNIDKAANSPLTVITAKVTRYPQSVKGFFLLILLVSIGKPLIKRSFSHTLRAIEQQTRTHL
jgi:hypothetical protein